MNSLRVSSRNTNVIISQSITPQIIKEGKNDGSTNDIKTNKYQHIYSL